MKWFSCYVILLLWCVFQRGAHGQGPIPGLNIKCLQPVIQGDCRAFITQWYYNPSAGFCDCFVYSGCKGGPNQFDSLSECMHSCNVHREQQLITANCRNLLSGTPELHQLLNQNSFDGLDSLPSKPETHNSQVPPATPTFNVNERPKLPPRPFGLLPVAPPGPIQTFFNNKPFLNQQNLPNTNNQQGFQQPVIDQQQNFGNSFQPQHAVNNQQQTSGNSFQPQQPVNNQQPSFGDRIQPQQQPVDNQQQNFDNTFQSQQSANSQQHNSGNSFQPQQPVNNQQHNTGNSFRPQQPVNNQQHNTGNSFRPQQPVNNQQQNFGNSFQPSSNVGQNNNQNSFQQPSSIDTQHQHNLQQNADNEESDAFEGFGLRPVSQSVSGQRDSKNSFAANQPANNFFRPATHPWHREN